MKTQLTIISMLALGSILTFTACTKQVETDANSVSISIDIGSPDEPQLLLDTLPEGQVPGVIKALQDAQAGEVVMFTGRVGGVRDPLMKDFAAFVIADEILEFCDEMANPGHCPAPWDACCEDPEKVSEARAFVQFVDESGAPLALDLEQEIGLAANKNVIVKGRLSAESTPGNRIILAEGISILN